jgi:hypothetical protein
MLRVWRLYRRKGALMRPASGTGFWQRHRTWLIAGLSFVAAAPVAFVFVFPAAGAAACPQCFGFERAEDSIYVERSMAPEARAAAVRTIERARERVGAFYGERRGEAIVLICATDDCYQRLRGGGSRGMAVYDRVLMLSPEGITETIAAHELAHIELHRRVGAWKIFRDAIPTWFDEGLAVVVSDDPHYLAPRGSGDRCLLRTDRPLPETLREWLRAANNERLYALSACRVHNWLTANGGPAAAVQLAQRIAEGASFDAVYR